MSRRTPRSTPHDTLVPDTTLVRSTAAAAEKDDRLGHHRAVLGEAERQRVDPDAPGDVGGSAAENVDGVGNTRAVHVQLQPLALRDLADLARSEEHTSELHSLMRPSYAVFFLNI